MDQHATIVVRLVSTDRKRESAQTAKVVFHVEPPAIGHTLCLDTTDPDIMTSRQSMRPLPLLERGKLTVSLGYEGRLVVEGEPIKLGSTTSLSQVLPGGWVFTGVVSPTLTGLGEALTSFRLCGVWNPGAAEAVPNIALVKTGFRLRYSGETTAACGLFEPFTSADGAHDWLVHVFPHIGDAQRLRCYMTHMARGMRRHSRGCLLLSQGARLDVRLSVNGGGSVSTTFVFTAARLQKLASRKSLERVDATGWRVVLWARTDKATLAKPLPGAVEVTSITFFRPVRRAVKGSIARCDEHELVSAWAD